MINTESINIDGVTNIFSLSGNIGRDWSSSKPLPGTSTNTLAALICLSSNEQTPMQIVFHYDDHAIYLRAYVSGSGWTNWSKAS